MSLLSEVVAPPGRELKQSKPRLEQLEAERLQRPLPVSATMTLLIGWSLCNQGLQESLPGSGFNQTITFSCGEERCSQLPRSERMLLF